MSQSAGRGVENSTFKRHTVVATDCVNRGGYDVLSTPSVVRLVEETAIDTLCKVVTTDHSSVGSRIELVHSGPTLLQQSITVTVSIREIDRRRYVFDVEVRDELEVVVHGTHERFVVDGDKFVRKLAAKHREFGLAVSGNNQTSEPN